MGLWLRLRSITLVRCGLEDFVELILGPHSRLIALLLIVTPLQVKDPLFEYRLSVLSTFNVVVTFFLIVWGLCIVMINFISSFPICYPSAS